MLALLQQSTVLFTLVVFVVSLVIGSFLNVVIHRLPIMLERDWRAQCRALLALGGEEPVAPRYDLIMPGSACPSCAAPIPARHNLPVLSYLWLRGRCARCGWRIPLRYPLVELGTAASSALVAWWFGLGWQAAAALLITWSLIALAGIDLDKQLLPDSITLPLLWLGLLASLAVGAQPAGPIVDPREAIIGAAAGYLSLWSVYWLFKLLTGKEGMGHGDFKLLAALGAWLGWKMLPLVIVLAAFVGAFVGIGLILFRGHDRRIPIPFGPYLAAAGWIAMIWGEELMSGYLRLS